MVVRAATGAWAALAQTLIVAARAEGVRATSWRKLWDLTGLAAAIYGIQGCPGLPHASYPVARQR